MAKSAVGIVKHGASNLSHSFSAKSNKYKFTEEEPLVAGWLFRGTSVADLVNKRYAKVFSSTLKTYRQEAANAQATKVWEFEEGCQVTEIEKREFMIREKGASTVWALARHLYQKELLYHFTIKFPYGNPHHKDPFLICFESKETAEQWRHHICQAISSFSNSTSQIGTAPPAHEEIQYEESPAQSAFEIAPRTPPAPLVPDISKESIEETFAPLDLSQQEKESFQAQMEEIWGTSPNLLIESSSQRSSIEHVNGVAVYQEGPSPDGTQGAYLVSAVIAASPRAVFEKLAAFDENKERPMPFAWELLQRIDSHARIVRHKMPSGRFAALTCAPREIVLQQTWREDEDGTITVLGQSVDHPAARCEASWSWYSPVRVQVEAAGFTLAPLQRAYRQQGTSTSCLCTFVLKADLGGCLSQQSIINALAYPWTRSLTRSFIDPCLMSVIALRDQVEQSKYVNQSFMPSAHEPVTEEVPAQRVFSQNISTLQPMDRTTSNNMRVTRNGPEPIQTVFAGPTIGDALDPVEEPAYKPDEEISFSDSVTRARDLATLASKYWSCPGSAGFVVRGPSYLKDAKKIPAEDPLFSLATVDLVKCKTRAGHLALHLDSIKKTSAPFNFVLNLMLPGAGNMAMVVTWAAEQAPVHNEGLSSRSSTASNHLGTADSDSEIGLSPFDTVLARFLSGDGEDADSRRNGVFKLIPTIVKGSWIAKQSVGHTPVLLGRKVKTYYYRGPNYFEVDVDITTSRAANSITGMVIGATTSMIIDMGIVLEGHSEEELPECLLGTVRIDHLDMKDFTVLDNSADASNKKAM